MIRKITLLIALFFTGLLIAFTTRDNFEDLIRGLFVKLSNQNIRIHEPKIRISVLLVPEYYYLLWAFLFVVFCYSKHKMNKVFVIRLVMIEVVVFFLALVGISFISAHIMLGACTECTPILSIYDSDVPYNLVILSSLAFGITPSLIYQLIQQRKRRGVVESNT